ncbi:MAG: ATP-binding protein [Ferruginibacter sp.]
MVANSAGLTALTIALLFVIYQNKRKTARKLNAQNDTLTDLNKQLNEANETKAKLFGIISHDLRSPVYQLYQFLKLKQTGYLNTMSMVKQNELEQETYTASSTLLDNIDNLLVWSKWQMHAFKADKKNVDIGAIVKKTLELLSLQIQSKQLHIKTQIGANNIIITDFNFLFTILRNLLQNSIHASPENGIIVITFFETAPGSNIGKLKITNEGHAFTQEDYLNAVKTSKTSRLLISGLGFQIINELSQKIGVDILFEAYDDNATCCTLTFGDYLN